MRVDHKRRMNELAGRPFWQRADIIVTWLMIGLPVLLLIGAGMFFVVTEGLFGIFAAVSLSCMVVLLAIRVSWRRWRSVRAAGIDAELPSIVADSSWSPFEREVFEKACARIRENTRELHSWDEGLFAMAFDVAGDVADQLSGGARGNLDVTLPEMLALVDEAAGECREYLETNLMFSVLRGISVRNTLWVLRNRHLLARFVEGGNHVHRLVSLVINPPAGAIRLLESLVAGDNTRYLTDQFQIELQRRIMTYVAAKSIDLYSGRYKRSSISKPGYVNVEPVKILLAGQTGAGKSSLAAVIAPPGRNASLKADGNASTVLARTSIDGIQCVLVELPGIDAPAGKQLRPAPLGMGRGRRGGAESTFAVIRKEFLDCDMVVWAVRADQPARKVDVDALAAFREAYGIQKWHRLIPPLVVAVSHVDRSSIIRSWPGSGALSPAQILKIEEVAGGIAREFEVDKAIPVKLSPPAWNVEEIAAGIRNALPNACLAQNNRLRAAGRRKTEKQVSQGPKEQQNEVAERGLVFRTILPDKARERALKAAGRARELLPDRRKLKKRPGAGKWRKDES